MANALDLQSGGLGSSPTCSTTLIELFVNNVLLKLTQIGNIGTHKSILCRVARAVRGWSAKLVRTVQLRYPTLFLVKLQEV